MTCALHLEIISRYFSLFLVNIMQGSCNVNNENLWFLVCPFRHFKALISSQKSQVRRINRIIPLKTQFQYLFDLPSLSHPIKNIAILPVGWLLQNFQIKQASFQDQPPSPPNPPLKCRQTSAENFSLPSI